MADYYFKAERMAVGYQGKPVIEEISFGIKRGEILTLAGPNGAGKSTLLKSIARQLSLIAGTAYIGKRELFQIGKTELAKELAVVFTERLHAEMMTCEDVVAAGRYPYTGKFGVLSKEDEQVVREAMSLVRADEIAQRDFTKISDGQRQRVLLARAIAQEPDMILLDEPTSYLDIKYKLEFLSVLQRMTRKKCLSVIMSLHELDLAERISDQVMCVADGRVDRFGTPEEVFTSGYIGKLFRMTAGSFEENSGSLELEAPRGKVQVFVIAGNGSGKSLFRRLQRANIAFAAGILFENDLDYPIARALGVHTVAEEAFQTIRDQKLEEAKAWVDQCETVICCRDRFGVWDKENALLLEYAGAHKKKIEKPKDFFHNIQVGTCEA